MTHTARAHRILSQPAGLSALSAIRRGIEKESLRMTSEGSLARSSHPESLGNALTHPRITTDFAESQLEFISSVHRRIDDCFNELLDLHTFVYQKLAPVDELLWTSSMPCLIGGEEDIPIAEFGNTNAGRLKHLYRVSLALRYGAKMQTVSGIHYNLSFPNELLTELCDSPTAAYMHLIRNVNRHAWLLILLYGASPALCHTYLAEGVRHKLDRWDAGTLYRREATSLRMGPLGYTGRSQRRLHISCNSLDTYARSLRKAMNKHYAPFAALGLRANGQRHQMNTHLLQFEAEHYSNIRPKRIPKPGERPLEALIRAGVEYVELRCVDLNPYEPLGINAEQVRFLDTFLLACLLGESREDSPDEARENRRNLWRMVRSGRAPDLTLKSGGSSREARSWALELLDDCLAAAELLDAANATHQYVEAVKRQVGNIHFPELTPSARVLRQLASSGQSFFSYSRELALYNQKLMLERTLAPERLAEFEAEVSASLTEAQRLGQQPQANFDEFVDAWLARC